METREIIAKLLPINEGMHESYMDLEGQQSWLKELSRLIRELQALPPNRQLQTETKSDQVFDGEYRIEYVEADIVQLIRLR